MSHHTLLEAKRPDPDQVLVDIADYVLNYDVSQSQEALETARYCLLDSLGCAMLALSYPACTKLLGPLVPGTIVPHGAKVPGTKKKRAVTYSIDYSLCSLCGLCVDLRLLNLPAPAHILGRAWRAEGGRMAGRLASECGVDVASALLRLDLGAAAAQVCDVGGGGVRETTHRKERP